MNIGRFKLALENAQVAVSSLIIGLVKKTFLLLHNLRGVSFSIALMKNKIAMVAVRSATTGDIFGGIASINKN